MPEVRIFNPSYTPRSFFAGKGGNMARHHRRHHRSRRRRNPFGISGGVVKDAAYVAVGVVGSPMVANFLGQSGWLNVLAIAGSALGLSYVGKMIGGATAGEDGLKGGLSATILA